MRARKLVKKILVPKELDKHLDTMPIAVGQSGWDPYGLNLDGAKVAVSVLKWLYDYYFRVEAFGLENVPAKGPVMVVANHSGQLPFDGILVALAMATNPHGSRAPRAMVERFAPTVPFVGNWLSSVGCVVGDPLNCVSMLKRGEAVIVFPEGVRGSGKLFYKRYQLQRFGNGFMHIAMELGVPVVPVGVVGCEESMPAPFHLKTLAKLLGFPYVPFTVPFPLPTKVLLHFGEPMCFDGDVVNEDLVSMKTDKVKAVIEGLIHQGLDKRKGWFH
ncbi:MAG: 1-acyl-sn-glycerol-3-phosphate acyltransferase [Deltaproteobacteria bacterium]|nr:1-acyl-sn-glycerol-3-phosphate acyltransferase [Deltaproteobacteria bacterium]